MLGEHLKKRPGLWLFISMMLVNAGNYGFNVLVGRWLGPSAYAEINLMITLFLIATFITSGLQMSAARAIVGSNNQAILTMLRRVAWVCGGLSLLGLGLFAAFWQTLFHTASASPFIILGVGLACYYALGVERGIAQGCAHFGRLAWNFQIEMAVRLMGACVFVGLGMGVAGATIALSSSIVIAWLDSRRSYATVEQHRTNNSIQLQMMLPIIIHLLGQVLINNSDVLLVKAWFPAMIAGQYAALALIGRVVFFATATLGTILFPRVLRSTQHSEQQRLFWQSIMITVAIAGLITLLCKIIPQLILGWLFGEAYLPIADFLWLYAVATSCYAIANISITYQLAQDRSFGAWIALLAGSIQIGVMSWFNQSIHQILYSQVGVMLGLLLVLMLYEFYRARARQKFSKSRVI
ncbi:hypothetical protein [Herpetosiphon sp.]|uniref:hypothetical protein n=1 Tax=Herpetosiphon sp. TaxID=71864 RepID=UPI00257E37E1|nr:hypothetical protein [Herpetosiphon sp.]